uniref:Reverse transcriptase domain-containing protein n=1 Tax=Tanacetum cinerariifolium TaxID=118510 RepID=A0A6L2KUT2_TANCI|nr:reverse transcriptase domain-containing protein [Tanacetum cinerariifolium]
MSTRSSAKNLFLPLDNPELTIQRRSRADPTLLNDFEMAAEETGDLPVPDLRTMEELCQPSLNGRVHNSCQFHGLPGDDANKHLDKFLHVTQSIKVNGVTDYALHLYLFPHSLTHYATACFDRLPRNSINTFEQMAKMFLRKYFPPSVVTKLRNEITNFRQHPDESLFEAWERYKLLIDRCPNHNMLSVTQIDTFYNSLTLRHRETINVAAGGTFMKRRPEECYDLIENITAHHNDWDTSAQQNDHRWPNLERICCESLPRNHVIPQGNNQGRNQFFQGASHGQNPPPAYQALGYQAPVHQPQIPQPQVATSNEFTNFMKTNDAILKNMQTNMTSLINSNLEHKNMFGQFMKINTASSLGSGTLPCNTITNPKEDLKGITTRSGTAYQGPTIPTTSSSLPPIVECETEVTKDMVHPTNNESTKDVQPPVVQTESPILNYEPVVAPIIEPVAAPVSAPKPNQKPSILYPSRLHDQKLRDKANDQRDKFFQIFKDLNFNISFADALILMPKFGPTIKTLLTNKDKLSKLARTLINEYCSVVLLKKLLEKLGDPGKFLIPCDFSRMAECLALADLGASINLMPLSVWNKLSLPDLSPTCMALELADHSISHSVGVAEDVFIKVGTLHFPADFVVVDFDADPRVPLILGRSLLKTERALIDVFKGELTLCVGKEAITFNLNQTSRYSANYNDMTANQIDVIDMACEEYSQEVLGFFEVITRGILLLKAFLNDDPSLPPPNQGNYLPQIQKELKIDEAKTDKSSIDEPLEVELKDLPPHLEYAFLEAVQHQRRINPKIHDVIKNEVLKLIDAGLIYSISNSPWVSPVRCVSKKGGFTIVENEENELIPTHLVIGWRVYIDYCKLNEATRKDHFPLPLMDQMLKRLARNEYYYFLDGFSGYFQMHIDLKDQENTTVTSPYGTFAYRRMPFGLCNAPGTFQRNSFQTCLSHLEKMLKQCEDTNLCLNWEKSHFMIKEGIVLGHKISKNRIEVDKAKVEVIAKLPHPTTVNGICCFLGHVGFYRHFIKDFSKIARPMTYLLEKDTPFLFSKEYVESFQTLKTKLNEAQILIAPYWDLPFELMCDASDFAIGVVLGQRQEKHFRPIHYASKTMTEAESNYTTTKKEMLAMVKPLTFSRLATMDPPGAIMARITLPRRFGTPGAIISDRGTHFCNDQFAKVMLKFGITHRLATSYHPQTSGQVEVSNCGLKQILERTVGENRASWNSRILKTCAKDFVLQSSLPQLHLGIIYPTLIELTSIFWHTL